MQERHGRTGGGRAFPAAARYQELVGAVGVLDAQADVGLQFAQQPRAFDSYVQQFDRAVNGEDKVVVGAQYSGFLEFKAKGAPLEFVFPAKGVPASPQVWGVIDRAPHPQAGRLFLDWFLSPVGQKVMQEALYLNSPRADAVPPPGGVSAANLKLLFPTDWEAFLSSRKAFAQEWDKATGLK